MPIRLRRKIFTRLRGRGRRVPTQGARSPRRRALAPCKKLHSVWLEQRRAAAQHAFSKGCDRLGLGKAAGMTTYAAHHPGVFVVDLALHHAMAEGCVVFGRWDPSLARLLGQIEANEKRPSRVKDLMAEELIQRFVGNPFQGQAQQDKADVAVLGAASRVGNKGDLESLWQPSLAVLGRFKQLTLVTESRTMV